jgi:hypothetical protein
VISVVIESWNIAGDARILAEHLALLAPQVAAHGAQVVVTHAGISVADRDAVGANATSPILWVDLPADAGYYEHKNRGFDAATGDIVAFIDGDCAPEPAWLDAIVAPFAGGAQVVAGATSYAGALAALANELDFPYFAAPTFRFGATCPRGAPTVLNFFANNVAFARDVFAKRRYPTITPMFHGQCQVLALELGDAGISITFAREARVTHGWPGGLRQWLEVRLLRGADARQLLPHVLTRYAPATVPVVRALGPLPALAMLAMRAMTGTVSALRRGPRASALALVVVVTALDAVGAVAAPAVYRWVGPVSARVAATEPVDTRAGTRQAA